LDVWLLWGRTCAFSLEMEDVAKMRIGRTKRAAESRGKYKLIEMDENV